MGWEHGRDQVAAALAEVGLALVPDPAGGGGFVVEGDTFPTAS